MNARTAKTLMVQGTASDVGKSILTAALCRIFVQDGLHTAPYKSQNMSLNSYVTYDGKEIGRAQGVQADACKILATTDMNPILLKPKQDMISQVVVHGKPFMDLDARTYRETYLPQAEQVVKDALARLRSEYDLVILEGAGSPAEVNLKDRDIVNMRLAGWADAPVILAADIDRGGVFASIVGTLEILSEEERTRVKGFIINKFRGDITLLQPGLDWLEKRTGKPVLGVIPYLPQLGIEDEDSASLDSKQKQRVFDWEDQPKRADQLDIAVIRLPRISNFTDFDPLHEEQDVYFRYISHVTEWGDPDVIILPGSKNTMADMQYLQQSGFADKILRHVHHQRRWALGICAGYQMMGRKLLDPEGLESDVPELSGLDLLPTETIFTSDKRTVQVAGSSQLHTDDGDIPVSGYEIHMGRTRFLEPTQHLLQIRNASSAEQLHDDGAVALDGRVWGTYVHGILHNDDFRRAWLNQIRSSKGLDPLPAGLRFKERREAAFDRLAEHVRGHLDMRKVYEMIGLSETPKQAEEG
jgi:adenosylcobyric acid synthase